MMTDVQKALKDRPLERGRAAAAAREFSRRADAEGLVDVAFASTDSPFGPLLVASTASGLVRLAYPNEDRDAVLQQLAAHLSPRVIESPARLDAVRRSLDEYFAGRRTDFGITVDFALTAGFRRRVLEATHAIPFGAVLTYMQVAERAGNPRASRATGNALGSNPIPIVVPCHRVVRTGGTLGGYTGGLDRKVTLLRLEGVTL